MKTNLITLIATVAIPLTAIADPKANSDQISIEQMTKDGMEITGKPTKIPDKKDLPEKIFTKFFNLSVTDVGEAATKLKEHIHEKPFQAVPDHRTSRMFLMGSERAINRAIEMLNKMERKHAGAGQPAPRLESNSEGSDKPQPESDGRSR